MKLASLAAVTSLCALALIACGSSERGREAVGGNLYRSQHFVGMARSAAISTGGAPERIDRALADAFNLEASLTQIGLKRFLESMAIAEHSNQRLISMLAKAEQLAALGRAAARLNKNEKGAPASFREIWNRFADREFILIQSRLRAQELLREPLRAVVRVGRALLRKYPVGPVPNSAWGGAYLPVDALLALLGSQGGRLKRELGQNLRRVELSEHELLVFLVESGDEAFIKRVRDVARSDPQGAFAVFVNAVHAG